MKNILTYLHVIQSVCAQTLAYHFFIINEIHANLWIHLKNLWSTCSSFDNAPLLWCTKQWLLHMKWNTSLGHGLWEMHGWNRTGANHLWHPLMTFTRWGSGWGGCMRMAGRGSAPCGRPHRKLEPKGHPFMTSTKKSGFWPPPLSTWAGPPPPCGRPHAVDMKYTPLSWNG